MVERGSDFLKAMFTIVYRWEDRLSRETKADVFCKNGVQNSGVVYSRVLFIVDEPSGIFLIAYDIDFQYISDTWHQTIEEAIQQVHFEYGSEIPNWVDVSISSDDEAAYIDVAKSVLNPVYRDKTNH